MQHNINCLACLARFYSKRKVLFTVSLDVHSGGLRSEGLSLGYPFEMQNMQSKCYVLDVIEVKCLTCV